MILEAFRDAATLAGCARGVEGGAMGEETPPRVGGRRRRSSSRPDRSADIAVGARVHVLPGRQFPSFGAGDVGTVCRVDREARTCDVLFEGQTGGPVPVALRHLVVDECCGNSRLNQSSQFLSPGRADDHACRNLSDSLADANGDFGPQQSQQLHQPSMIQGICSSARGANGSLSWDVTEDLASKVTTLEERSASQERAFANLERRVAACEAAAGVGPTGPGAGGQVGGPAGRVVAARVAALEGARQAEIAELRRSLDEALALGREQESLHRKQRVSTRKLEQQVEEVEERTVGLREMAQLLSHDVERLGGALEEQASRARGLEASLGAAGGGLESQERRARCVEEVVGAAEAGLRHMSELLEGQERRTADLGHAISRASSSLDSQERRLAAWERRAESLPAAASGDNHQGQAAAGRKESEPVWRALRELQELVVHESEHRAAGLREVLSVLGQGIEQLRSEQAQTMADFEGKSREEGRRAKQRQREMQLRHADQEKRVEAMDERLEALGQALASERLERAQAIGLVEQQVLSRSRCSLGTPGFSDIADVVASPVQEPPAPDLAAPAVTSQSLQRLEALEARFDRHGGRGGEAPATSARAGAPQRRLSGPGYGGGRESSAERRQPSTEGVFRRLRPQLDGLRSELADAIAADAPASGDLASASSNTDPLLATSSTLGVARAVADSGEPRQVHLGMQQRQGPAYTPPRGSQMSRSRSAPSGLQASDQQAASPVLHGASVFSQVAPRLAARAAQQAAEGGRDSAIAMMDAGSRQSSTPSFAASSSPQPRTRVVEPAQPLSTTARVFQLGGGGGARAGAVAFAGAGGSRDGLCDQGWGSGDGTAEPVVAGSGAHQDRAAVAQLRRQAYAAAEPSALRQPSLERSASHSGVLSLPDQGSEAAAAQRSMRRAAGAAKGSMSEWRRD